MRTVDSAAIARHAAVRYRSEYDYAVFEYWRSAKVTEWLDPPLGLVLDDGCGAGGMCVSLAEEAKHVVGIDCETRFVGAGTRLAAERDVTNLTFLQADSLGLPCSAETFDTVVSHAVIEHVDDADRYLSEAARVLSPGGRMYLVTSPYLSPHGSHFPYLRGRIPVHLLLPRRAAGAVYRWIGAHRPEWIDAPEFGSKYLAQHGDVEDSLRTFVTVRKLERAIARAGLHIVRKARHVSRAVARIVPSAVGLALPEIPLVRDVTVNSVEFLLMRLMR